MKIETPRTFEGDPVAAHESARSSGEPVFVPARVFADDRGWSVMNQLQGVMAAQGQINFSMMYPSVVKAWHRHTVQTDFWMGLLGHLTVGVHSEQGARSWRLVIGEKRPGVLVIPPGLWHGAATVGHEPAGLLYYVTHAYNHEQPDEQRRAYDSIEGFPWGVMHG